MIHGDTTVNIGGPTRASNYKLTTANLSLSV